MYSVRGPHRNFLIYALCFPTGCTSRAKTRTVLELRLLVTIPYIFSSTHHRSRSAIFFLFWAMSSLIMFRLNLVMLSTRLCEFIFIPLRRFHPHTFASVMTATEVGVRAIQDHKVIEWNTCWKCRLLGGTDDK